MINALKSVSGIKRTLSGALDALALPLTFFPGGDSVAVLINTIAASVGGVGLAHAVKKKQIKDFPLATAASLCSICTFASYNIPALSVYAPVLHDITSLLGAAAVGNFKKSTLPSTDKKAKGKIRLVKKK